MSAVIGSGAVATTAIALLGFTAISHHLTALRGAPMQGQFRTTPASSIPPRVDPEEPERDIPAQTMTAETPGSAETTGASMK